jgi:hypothetical protein
MLVQLLLAILALFVTYLFFLHQPAVAPSSLASRLREAEEAVRQDENRKGLLIDNPVSSDVAAGGRDFAHETTALNSQDERTQSVGNLPAGGGVGGGATGLSLTDALKVEAEKAANARANGENPSNRMDPHTAVRALLKNTEYVVAAHYLFWHSIETSSPTSPCSRCVLGIYSALAPNFSNHCH